MITPLRVSNRGGFIREASPSPLLILLILQAAVFEVLQRSPE